LRSAAIGRRGERRTAQGEANGLFRSLRQVKMIVLTQNQGEEVRERQLQEDGKC